MQKPRAERPVIAISCDVVPGPPPASHLSLSYSDAVAEAGGAPVLLPPFSSRAALERALSAADGLLFTGGDDYDPSAYRQRRHRAHLPIHPRRQRGDLLAARRALRTGIPILGICNGLQLLNIALGGDLIQDISDLVPGAGVHRSRKGGPPARHRVRIEPGTLLEKLIGRREVAVNTFHHQAIGRLGRGLRVSAVAVDGVVEAIEMAGKRDRAAEGRFLLGVQWHPERDRIPFNLAIFRGLIEASRVSWRERGRRERGR